MKLVTKKQQEKIDKLNIKKIMFALVLKPIVGVVRKQAEDIYYSDNVMLPEGVDE